MPLLVDLALADSLQRGDILRLPHNYDLGPGSPPVDLMVFDPRDEEAGAGLMVVSGYKAGLVLHIFPRESRNVDGGISVEWLRRHWHSWFVFTYSAEKMPFEQAHVLRRDARTIPEEL